MKPYYFAAGPSSIPDSVLQEAQKALEAVPAMHSLSLVEISHRSSWFEAQVLEAESLIKSLLNLPEGYQVLFLQGGARQQFAQIPMNFLKSTERAYYLDSGVFANMAYREAQSLGDAKILSSSGKDYDGLPTVKPLPEDGPKVAYVHTTTNNTIYGTQNRESLSFSAPHVSDMSSDILSRPIEASRYQLIYAGAQKNIGIPGVTLVILDPDFLESGRNDIPEYWQYRAHAKRHSLLNTPPTFSIYVLLLMCRWLEKEGGLLAISEKNEDKARQLYLALDESEGFYKGVAKPSARSLMNVTFRLKTEALEAEFLKAAEAKGLLGLKGHRSAGGIRASIYNAMPLSGVEALIAFMRQFQADH